MPATETRKLGSAPRPAVLMTARIAALLGREQCRGLALRRRIELREPRHARGRLRGDSLAVAEHEAPIARCRRTLTFVEHVREIERVGRGERDPFVRLLVATQAPQLLHGLDQRELLAAQRLDEPAAANLAARLRAAIDRQQLTPRRRERLARQQLAADHAVAAQQDLRGLLERLGANGARKPWNESEVTSPRATSSPKASSTCTRSKPLRCTSSRKNSAPRSCSACSTRSAAPDKPSLAGATTSARQSGDAARGTIAIGDVATVLARPGAAAPLGRGRHQTNSPALQS